MRSNCLLFALSRWRERGGYIVITRSLFGWWPHFEWSADLKTFEQFAPFGRKRKRLFPPLYFRGHVTQSTHKGNHEERSIY